jgi:hypothetical protein
MWTWGYWKGVLERAIRAAAAAVGALLVTLDLTNTASIPWERYMWAGLVAAAISACLSVAGNGLGVGPAGSASLVPDRATDPENQ